MLAAFAHLLGGEAASRAAAEFGVAVSPDTLLRFLAEGTLYQGPAPRLLGVDDFAFRRGHTYGTILVDLETGQPVDLLPDRRGETLAQWLRDHPGAEIVTRDRNLANAEAIRTAAPEATQVADRFHLVKNLVEIDEELLPDEAENLRRH